MSHQPANAEPFRGHLDVKPVLPFVHGAAALCEALWKAR